MRLETAATSTCIPPCVAPLQPPGAAAAAPPADGDGVAHRAALRQLWRALKLLQTMNEWSELLATPALQQLGGALLSAHVLPYLRVQLAARPPRLELVATACERAAGALPAAWRRRDARGARTPCAGPLHGFVLELGGAAGAGRGGGAALLGRVAELLTMLDDAAAATSLRMTA